jgi:flavorubredoxin
VLKKVADLDIAIICPLHGPVLNDNLSYYIGLYDTWSSYRPEDKGVVICVSSIYGHTMDAARLLELKLTEFGCPKVSVFDLARDDMAEAVEDAFRYDRLVLASVTYNGTIFPDMNTFISHLTERNYQNRTIAFMENGSWAPAAARIMGKLFEKSKNIKIAENKVTIKSALNEDSIAQIEALARELL